MNFFCLFYTFYWCTMNFFVASWCICSLLILNKIRKIWQPTRKSSEVYRLRNTGVDDLFNILYATDVNAIKILQNVIPKSHRFKKDIMYWHFSECQEELFGCKIISFKTCKLTSHLFCCCKNVKSKVHRRKGSALFNVYV